MSTETVAQTTFGSPRRSRVAPRGGGDTVTWGLTVVECAGATTGGKQPRARAFRFARDRGSEDLPRGSLASGEAPP